MLKWRQQFTQQWLGWWRKYLGGMNAVAKGALLPIEAVEGYLVENEFNHAGALFAAGCEGTMAHRKAVDYIVKNVTPLVLGFERDEYMRGKPRKEPFLPLQIRLYMWQHYLQGGVLTVLPERLAEVSVHDHYLHLFQLTGARFSFATLGDPHLYEKIGRGEAAHFTRIPIFRSAHTTDHVSRLFGRYESDNAQVAEAYADATALMKSDEKMISVLTMKSYGL